MLVQRDMPQAQPQKPKLWSVKVVSNKGYLNTDPAMPFLLPFGQWKVNELADQILRACADYDILATWDQAKFLALAISKAVIKETFDTFSAKEDPADSVSAAQSEGYYLDWN